MRLHTDTISESDVYAAARTARVDLVGFSRHGSRKRDHAFEVKLEGESCRRPNHGKAGWDSDYGYAATWDQWGVFIATLFSVDPDAIIGMYPTRNAFDAFTRYRFDADSFPSDYHGDHSWNGSTCRKCSAGQEWQALRDPASA